MIIQFTKDTNATQDISMAYPDQFLKESEKLDSESWIKGTADYFANIAYIQYNANRKNIVKNYNLVKGLLTPADFYENEEPTLKSFTDVLAKEVELPDYVQHYSILGPPLNTLVGELIKRPDTHRIKAFDDESKNEELSYKTDLLQQYIRQKLQDEAKMCIQMNPEAYPPQTGQDGQPESEEEQVGRLTQDKVKEYMINYTSMAEKWANHTLESCKAEFSMKEKAEEAFRDLLICAREFFHVYETNSKTGFDVDVVNGKNVWQLSTPDRKYTKDAYAAGTIEVMEISEIIEKMTDLTKDEIDHLRKTSRTAGDLIGRSNYGSQETGINTIKYDTYNRVLLQERLLAESELGTDNKDILTELFGRNVSLSQYGEKFVVIRGYFKSKRLIKKVTYIDENNIEQTLLTDENYVDGSLPTELSVEEGWTSQWYQFIKIGADVYHMKPFKLLDYCPLIGAIPEIKNTQARSMVDLMKPFQTLYNICMNQLFKLLQKEIGVVYNITLRKIPVPKDGDAQNALDLWEEEAREKGIIFEDDSPENMKAPGNNTNNSRAIDLSRTSEIQSRYELAARLKIECWDLVGISRQRVGSVQATETATATNTAITQSYAQTEPIYASHEYLMDQVYQAIVDAAQYVESDKPISTLSYINSVGESIFIEMQGKELKGRDLKLFSTSRPQDQQTFNELKALAQPMLQNGASPDDIIALYTETSVRSLRQVFKTLKEEQQKFQEQEQQLKQQELDQQQQQHQADIEHDDNQHQIDVENENYNKAEDRLNKLEIATIMASNRTGGVPADANNNGVADALEVSRLALDENNVRKQHDIKLAELSMKDRHAQQQLQLERDKIQAERQRTRSDHEIALKKLVVERKKIAAKPKTPAKKKK